MPRFEPLALTALLSLATLTACEPTCDDEDVVVSGVVIDDDGEAFAGSEVRAMRASDYAAYYGGADTVEEGVDDTDDADDVEEPEWLVAEADDNGSFSFELDPDETWILWASWDDGRYNGTTCSGTHAELVPGCSPDLVEIVLDECTELD